VRSSIFWMVVQHSVMVCYWNCKTRHWSRLQGLVFHCLTLEGGTSVLFWNNCDKPPASAGENHRRAKTSGAQWWESETLQGIDLIIYVKSLLSIRMIVPIYYLCHHLFFLCLHMELKAVGYVCGWTIKFANLPPRACRGSTGQKP